MTALFMARVPDFGIIAAADGAFYSAEGRLEGVASKFTFLPEHDCVIALQGPFFYHAFLRGQLSPRDQGFDAILGIVVETVRSIYERPDEFAGHPICMLIGGFSTERDRWETYWLSSPAPAGMEPMPFEPWTLVPARATEWIPKFGADECSAAGIDPVTPLDQQGFSGHELAVRTICACRGVEGPLARRPDLLGHQVGGLIQVVEMQRGGVSTWIAHRWPDRIGEPLDPANGPLLPAALVARV